MAKFIDINYVFQHTDIDRNVDPDLLENYIDICQDLYIQQCIGNTLYVKLLNDIENNGTPIDQYLELLVKYVQPALAIWVKYEALPSINYRITNKAISEKNSDHSNPTQLPNVQYLRGTVQKTAERYSQRIREYIINNQMLFPEYFNVVGWDKMRPDPFNYFAGLYIPKYNPYGYTTRGGCDDCFK